MKVFNFDNTYLTLPEGFYSLVKLKDFEKSEFVLLNERLLQALNIVVDNPDDLLSIFNGRLVPENCTPFAQAYAGHQFGHFTMLGDGRTVVLGEHLSHDNQRFDLQLKGSGQTPYSRRGDGKATLRAMLREYLISEAMHALNIDSSGSLAVIKTNEPVYREVVNEGAVLVRVMKSHIRIGTFEYAAYSGREGDLNALLQYTINRLYPELQDSDNPALALLEKVMHVQINLVANWMRVGFIHGVMNTDNVAISGETFDYGPCAFMNAFHPQTVFSSIDVHGRYAFGNQPKILKWNLARFAQTLLPLIHQDEKKAVALAQDKIDGFDDLWNERYYAMMSAKTGLMDVQLADRSLIDELTDIMTRHQQDYTNTFSALANEMKADKFPGQQVFADMPFMQKWLEKWKLRIAENLHGSESALKLMHEHNPVFIPRNHRVEEALDKACGGDFSVFNNMLQMLQNPYDFRPEFRQFTDPPDVSFEGQYQTFCGT